MTDDRDVELTRRGALAALGSIGVASAGASLGTAAYLSDAERFGGDAFVAGSLDLKVHWQEHYVDGSADETVGVGTVQQSPGGGLTGFPSSAPADQQSVYVADPEAFLDNTAIEAFPDVLDESTAYDAQQATLTPDDQLCDLPADFDAGGGGVLSHPFRTRGTFGGGPNPQTTAPGDPVVDLGDVKPGDFGELTLSFHLCGNPGYVWLTGGLVSNDENAVLESEAADPDEDEAPTDTDLRGGGELLDAVRTRLWYDDGDDRYGGDDLAITPVLPLRELLARLDDGNGVRLCHAARRAVTDTTATTPTEERVDAVHATGDTVTVDTPQTDGPVKYTIPRNPTCADFGLTSATKIGDGEAGGDLPDDGASKTYATPYGEIEVTRDGETITAWSIEDGGTSSQWCVAKVVVKGGRGGANVYSYDTGDGADDWTGDGDSGALSDAAASLETPTGQAISHLSVCVAPTAGDSDREISESDGCCFPNSTSQHVGFEWWLPAEDVDEVQTDSVGFDLGFYTEQCRHNDGSGGDPGDA